MLIDTSSKLIADTVAADPNLKKELLSMSIANVLLVNDEIEFVEKFGERLRMRNLEIANAFSAKEARRYLKKTKCRDRYSGCNDAGNARD